MAGLCGVRVWRTGSETGGFFPPPRKRKHDPQHVGAKALCCPTCRWNFYLVFVAYPARWCKSVVLPTCRWNFYLVFVACPACPGPSGGCAMPRTRIPHAMHASNPNCTPTPAYIHKPAEHGHAQTHTRTHTHAQALRHSTTTIANKVRCSPRVFDCGRVARQFNLAVGCLQQLGMQ